MTRKKAFAFRDSNTTAPPFLKSLYKTLGQTLCGKRALSYTPKNKAWRRNCMHAHQLVSEFAASSRA